MDDYEKIVKEIGTLWSTVGKKAALLDIADSFSSVTRYACGRLAVYDGKLFQCTSEHYGEWNGDHFKRTTIESVVYSLVESLGEIRKKITELSDGAQERKANPVQCHEHFCSEDPLTIERIAPAWKPDNVYKAGVMVSHDARLYCSIVGHVSGAEFDKSKWTETTVSEMLDGFTSAISEVLRRRTT